MSPGRGGLAEHPGAARAPQRSRDGSEHQLLRRLHEVELRFSELFERNPGAIAELDPLGGIRDANPAFCAMVRLPRSALRGTPLESLVAGPMPNLVAMAEAKEHVHRVSVTFAGGIGGGATARVALIRVSGARPGEPRFICTFERLPEQAESRRLTENEARALQMRAAGCSVAQTAAALGVSTRGVDYLVAQVARKLRCPAKLPLVVSLAHHLGVFEAGAWPPRVAERHRR